MRLAPEVARLFDATSAGDGGVEAFRQAFPLLTIAASGHPHVCLLSTEQIEIGVDLETIFVSVAGHTTRDNLLDRGLATVVAVGGAAAHYLKSSVVDTTVVEGRTGFTLRVDEIKADSAGVELSPLGFRFSPELAIAERWARDRAVIESLKTRNLRAVDGD